MRTTLRFLAAALLLHLVLVACSGGGASGPTAPAAASTTGQVLSTSAGTLTVVDHGCGTDMNRRRLEGEVHTTTMIAEQQNPDAFAGERPLDGFEIHLRTSDDTYRRCDGNPACFERTGDRGRLHVWCDGGGLEHESAHALAWGARLGCWETVYHSRNFRCEVTDDLYGA